MTVTVRESWTDDTPVSPEFFGDLWPDGEPEGWPKDAEDDERVGSRELVVELSFQNNQDEQELLHLLERLAEVCDSYYRAYGGRGLKIKGIDIESQIEVGVTP